MVNQLEELMRYTIGLAVQNVETGSGGPFSAAVVKDGKIIATGVNLVTSSNDPTAHAEVVAIRDACKIMGSFQLSGCEILASCEPCPMCLGAIYWARLSKLYYAASKQDAAAAQFDDSFIYTELSMLPAHRTIPGYQLLPQEALLPFTAWAASLAKIRY